MYIMYVMYVLYVTYVMYACMHVCVCVCVRECVRVHTHIYIYIYKVGASDRHPYVYGAPSKTPFYVRCLFKIENAILAESFMNNCGWVNAAREATKKGGSNTHCKFTGEMLPWAWLLNRPPFPDMLIFV